MESLMPNQHSSRHLSPSQIPCRVEYNPTVWCPLYLGPLWGHNSCLALAREMSVCGLSVNCWSRLHASVHEPRCQVGCIVCACMRASHGSNLLMGCSLVTLSVTQRMNVLKCEEDLSDVVFHALTLFRRCLVSSLVPHEPRLPCGLLSCLAEPITVTVTVSFTLSCLACKVVCYLPPRAL